MRQKLLRKYSIIIIAIAATLLAILIYLVYYHPISHIDIAFSRDLQSEGDTGLSRTLFFSIFRSISFLGIPVVAGVMIVLSALLFWFFGYFRESIYILITVVGTPIEELAKLIIGRPRPPADVVKIIDQQSSPSFPSGHVVFFTIFFGFLIAAMIINKKIKLWIRVALASISTILVVLVSFSRVYLGSHWISDVIGGYLVGIIILCMILYFYLKPIFKISDRIKI
ncbi:MAG: phosphatase PAP2 family protein [Patescibacteria group bacterium]|jgi:undecaprenyl-diphosphatase